MIVFSYQSVYFMQQIIANNHCMIIG